MKQFFTRLMRIHFPTGFVRRTRPAFFPTRDRRTFSTRLRFAAAIALVTICAAVPVCLAGQESRTSMPPREGLPGPCRLCAEIGSEVNRDLISLQPMNGYAVEAGLAAWEEMRRAMPGPEAARYDSCFQNLADAYGFVLSAANAWAMASQTRVSVPLENLFSLNFELRMSLMSARALLERATGCCQKPLQSSKPK
jgi:hypothetical protein